MIDVRKAVLPAFALLALAVAACSGGGGGTTVPPTKDTNVKGTLAIKLAVPVPPPGVSAKTRRAFTVSGATQGLLVKLYTSPKTGTPPPVFTQAYDVSTPSPLCTANADTSRTCTISVSIGAGTYDVEALNYDQVPVAGAIPGAAHQLGYGLVAAQTVTGGATNAIALTVQGIPNSVFVTVPVKTMHTIIGLTQNVGVNVLDAAGSVIMGSFVDALGNPVTVTMSDAHSTGLATFAPATFTAPPTTGVAVTYNPGALTAAQVGAANSIAVTGTLSNNAAAGSASIVVPQLVTTYSGIGGGGPAGLTLDSSNLLWFTMPSYNLGGGNAGAINSFNTANGSFGASPAPVTAGLVPLGPTPAPDQILGAPGGKLWISNSNTAAMTSFTILGSLFTGYSISFGVPTALTTDGTYIWALQPSGNVVLQMTQAGVVQHQFTIPTISSGAKGIAADGSGNIWFTESNVNQIGEVVAAAPSAPPAEYVITTPNTHPYGIARGSDGNMWFTEANADRIASITPTGTITEYVMTSGSFVPQQIVTGPDNNLWFTIASTPLLIGRFDISTHAFTIVPIAASGTPSAIIKGPDGNLWVGDTANGALYRITP